MQTATEDPKKPRKPVRKATSKRAEAKALRTTPAPAPVKTAAPAKVTPKAKPRSKSEIEANVKRLLEAEDKANQRVAAEAEELAKLSPAELVKRWEENERNINRSRNQRDIYNVSWQTLCKRCFLLEDLIARNQTSPEGLVAKLKFLERKIDQDDTYSRELVVSCRVDAEQILDIIPL